MNPEEFSAFIAGSEKRDCAENVLRHAYSGRGNKRLEELARDILTSVGFVFREFHTSTPDIYLNLAKMDGELIEKIYRKCSEQHFSSIREFGKRGVKILRIENYKIFTVLSIGDQSRVYKVLGDLPNLKSILEQNPEIFDSCTEAYYGVNDWTFREHLKRSELKRRGNPVSEQRLEEWLDSYFNAIGNDEKRKEYQGYLKRIGGEIDAFVSISLSMPSVSQLMESEPLNTWQSGGDWTKPEEYARIEKGETILSYDVRELSCIRAAGKWKFLPFFLTHKRK